MSRLRYFRPWCSRATGFRRAKLVASVDQAAFSERLGRNARYAAMVNAVLFPLIVGDVTRDSGNYSTSLGPIDLASGGGATLSTVLAGLVGD
jgi:hypothetical protein